MIKTCINHHQIYFFIVIFFTFLTPKVCVFMISLHYCRLIINTLTFRGIFFFFGSTMCDVSAGAANRVAAFPQSGGGGRNMLSVV